MQFPKPDFAQIEQDLLAFWEEEGIREAANNPDGEPFSFIDGPPYTSGRVHIGTAWNKSMKDMLLRFRRMQGYDVWDRAGYDMHGLPIEHRAMAALGLKNKEDIHAYGLDRYIAYCKDFAIENLQRMNEEFIRLGVWMDFADAYQTISDEWISSVWWLVKKAYADGRLYEGLRPMYWDPEHETALAKHELEYRTVEDESIYVKFSSDQEDEYFVVWTTTPWTIPFNLMIMVNPEVTYARVQVDQETWIIAEDLVEAVLEAAGKKGTITETFPGEELVGRTYTHFLAGEIDYTDLGDVHRVVASKEYVTTETGSGLVHAAPGCGPEDYEVGIREGVPAFNLLDSRGCFPEGTGVFSGKRARYEDKDFTAEIAERGHLVATQPYVHEYPHAERSKAPIVYKATKQWFFKVDDLKDQMVAQNKDVHWQPNAGYNAFNSWLENLRDNSITKQRFWGTPFPVWRNTEDAEDLIIVGSKKELEELSGLDIAEMHKPWIDEVVIEKDGKTYKRLPDVIDVWVDAGAASFACLKYPEREDLFKRFYPADFIIEGNDQIRGWFNLLMVESTLAFQQAPFKNVYMHGMINDAKGRKMSKSEGNYILPEEVVSKYGADASRLYWIGGTKAGQDLNYNFDDCKTRQRNLLVYWNIHKYLLDLRSQYTPAPLADAELRVEDRYILSRAHSTAQRVAELIDAYALDRVPDVVEELLGDISRTYIQLVRGRLVEDAEAETVLAVLHEAFSIGVRLLAPIAPFISDAMWHNLKEPFSMEEQSIHLADFPQAQQDMIDAGLEEEMGRAMHVLSQVLAARDAAQIGVRWPLREAQVSGASLSEEIQGLIKQQANLHGLTLVDELPVEYIVAPNFRAIGKEYGQETAEIASHIKENAEALGKEYAEEGAITVGDRTLGEEYLDITAHAPEGYAYAADRGVAVLLAIEQDDELLREGYFRELVRRVQHARKEADLDRTDTIALVLDPSLKDVADPETLAPLVGASKVSFSEEIAEPHVTSYSVKDRELRFGFSHSK